MYVYIYFYLFIWYIKKFKCYEILMIKWIYFKMLCGRKILNYLKFDIIWENIDVFVIFLKEVIMVVFIIL